ncbi:hypothetical protein FFWV33_04330 [Flavobacterium faecale]|uniref:Uncharacterized protein n=1 Tax=Flavobacterium faecale TaxID=1355330 RepID=A0A2S1LAN5_9FLAO|nr:hypothetical protein FFWV33_04330 [Flavobacterium faecale]
MALFAVKIKIGDSIAMLSTMNLVLQSFCAVILLLLFYIKFQIKKTKTVSTYSFIFNLTSFYQIINLTLMIIGIYSFKKVSSIADAQILFYFYPVTFFTMTCLYINMGFQHLKFVKQTRELSQMNLK